MALSLTWPLELSDRGGYMSEQGFPHRMLEWEAYWGASWQVEPESDQGAFLDLRM